MLQSAYIDHKSYLDQVEFLCNLDLCKHISSQANERESFTDLMSK